MLRKPDDWQVTYVRALAAEQGRVAREKAARATGIGWGLTIGALVGIAGALLGLL